MLFAVLMTVYILAAIPFEERNLIAHFGEQYLEYRRTIGGLVPRLLARRPEEPRAERGAA